MKKWMPLASYILNGLLIMTLFMGKGCEKEEEKFDPLKHTQNNLENSVSLEYGDLKSKVLEVMGPPVVKEFLKDKEEWHYCRTGNAVDEYLSLVIESEKLASQAHYTVSALDLAFHHTDQPTEELLEYVRHGDCKLFIRWGSYGEASPSKAFKKN